MKGAKSRESIILSSADSYVKADIDIKLGSRIDSVVRDRHRVSIADGTHIEYDKLVLATGARARELPISKPGLSGVSYLRNMDDVDRIRARAIAR